MLAVTFGVLEFLAAPALAQTSTTAPASSETQPATTEPSGTSPSGSGTSVRGTLIDRKGTVDTKDDEPVKDVKITVTKESGEPVGSTLTDADGKFFIDIPTGEGSYVGTLDTSTLPKGVKLPESAATLKFTLGPGQSRVLLFDLNAATRSTTGKFDEFLQAVVDGTNFGLIIAMCAVGLSLIYGTTQLVNFAHGELVTLGAIVAYYFNVNFGWALLVAAPAAVVVVGGFGWLLDAGFWGPLRRRGTGHIAQMVISIGLALAMLNLYLYTFGGITKPYTDYHAQPAWSIGSIDLAPKKFASTMISLVVLIVVATALQRTRTGKAMRAISDNPDLAASSGINVDAVIRLVWMFGAGLAALGGILFSVSQDVNFEEGSSILLLLFAAITLGGLGAAYGALIGGFVVGLFVNVSTVWLPTELKNVGALFVLILVLLVRPQGILGRAERVG
jgi:branched-chain amino acid transport system permease protein